MLGDEQALRATRRQTLKDQLILLDALRRLIARTTREFRAQLRRSTAGQRLMTLPGVSTVLAYTIMAEIGAIERFGKSRSLTRYSLLAPCADDSEDKRPGKPIGRRIGQAGRHTLQWAWIEAARGAVRKDAHLREIFNRRTDNNTTDRNRGCITAANVMCKIAHAMLSKGTDDQEARPARPGTKKKHGGFSRPETGQPYRAMAPRQT